MTDVYFTKQMRKATREIHAASDALVNAKLAFDTGEWLGEAGLRIVVVGRSLGGPAPVVKKTIVGIDNCISGDGFHALELYKPEESGVLLGFNMNLCVYNLRDKDEACMKIFVATFRDAAPPLKTLSDNSVWAEGLLIFYEIFRYLEEAMDRLKDKHVGELDIEGMRRTKAFEQDLNFYLGNDWQKNYTPRESVAKYLLYLSKLETSDPDMLMAYIYHLYMGLLSGGQILARKRAIYQKLLPFSKQAEGGYAVTSFGDHPISKIKRNLVKAMNDVAQNLDEDTKNKLIEESKTVFVMNNEIIRTVEGANKVFLKKMAVAVAAVAVFAAAYAIWKHR